VDFEGRFQFWVFYGVANGRERKCTIFFLETEEGEIFEPVDLREHIESYYRHLFGKENRGDIRL
jgi:hypothetical protein